MATEQLTRGDHTAEVSPTPARARDGAGIITARTIPTVQDASAVVYLTSMLLALGIGATLRVILVGASAFPLGDGGMFYAMVRGLIAHGYTSSYFTAYNHAHIPFAYPPLGFYLVAYLHSVTHAPLLLLFRIVPATFAVLSIAAFASLARTLLTSRLAQVGAVLAFGVLPDSFLWEIKGGGITRAPGEFLALLALVQVVKLYRSHDRRYLVPSIVLCALTVMTHLEWTWFLAYSSMVVLAVYGRSRTSAAHTALLAAGVALGSSPWWGMVGFRYGLGTVLATFTGSAAALPVGGALAGLFLFHFVSENWAPVFTPLACIGVCVSLLERRWLLPLWLLIIFLVDWRGPTSRAVIPTALLAGVAMQALWVNLIEPRLSPYICRLHGRKPLHTRIAVGVLFLLVARAFLVGWAEAIVTPSALSTDEQSAMAWIAHSTPHTARFLVVSGAVWAFDDNAEWLPALTGRVSLNTVQGSEWIPGAFARSVAANASLQNCASHADPCVERWLTAHRLHPDYIYVTVAARVDQGGDCCALLRYSLDHTAHYRRVFHNRAVSIYAIRAATLPASNA